MLLDDIAWLIFIRAGSSRFPGKCYVPICGMNTLGWLSRRSMLAGIKETDLYVCTSMSQENTYIARQAKALGHGVLFGPEEFPVRRIIENWKHIEKYRYFVRICGDSPLFSFRAVLKAVATYQDLMPHAITNTRKRIFPAGFSIEVYETESFRRAVSIDQEIAQEEHMCNILAPQRFLGVNTVDMSTDDDLSFFSFPRYTVDYKEDVNHIERCIESGHAEECEVGLDNVKFK